MGGPFEAPHVLSRVEAALCRASADLGSLGRRWALVGGLAVSARTEPRFTRDADLAVFVDDDPDAERLVGDLQVRGWQVLTAMEEDATRRLAAVRLSSEGRAGDGVVVDVLFASSGVEAEVVGAAEPVEIFPGVVVPVAQPGHLIALKILSRDDRTRPQDSVDLRALLKGADDGVVAAARRVLALIVARGFHRGRDLERDLERALRELGPVADR